MSDLDDLSDPAGAGRGDRRRARRMVDDAYAAGRISAADRTLRVERVAAAATRGDLAMVVRDLGPRSGPAASDRPSAPAPPSPVTPSPLPAAPPTAPPAAPAPSAAPPQTGDALPWPPPGYGGDPSRSSDDGGSSRRKVGCIVAAVLLVLAFPLVLAVLGLVVALTFGSSVDEGTSQGVGTVQTPTDDVRSWWDDRIDALDAAAGSTVVREYSARPDRATALVPTPSGAGRWSYAGGVWAPVTDLSPERDDATVDLRDIGVDAVAAAVDDALFEIDTDAAPGVQVQVQPSMTGTTLVVRVTDAAGTQTRRYDTDGSPLD